MKIGLRKWFSLVHLMLYLIAKCVIAFLDDRDNGDPGSKFCFPNLAFGNVVSETRALAKGILDILSGDMPKGTKVQTKHLESLIELHSMTGLSQRISNTCFLNLKFKYGQIEHAILSSEIPGIELRGAVTLGVGAQGIELSETVRRMEESIPQVIVLLEAAVERCISFTEGSEAEELILALDDIMLQYISTLQETLKSLRVVCEVDNMGDGVGPKKEMGPDIKEGTHSARKIDTVSDKEEWSIVQGALQILTVADCLTSRSAGFEASLRATLARLSTSLSLSVFGSSADQNQSHVASND